VTEWEQNAQAAKTGITSAPEIVCPVAQTPICWAVELVMDHQHVFDVSMAIILKQGYVNFAHSF
jgi:hypothetical protein